MARSLPPARHPAPAQPVHFSATGALFQRYISAISALFRRYFSATSALHQLDFGATIESWGTSSGFGKSDDGTP